MGTAARLTLERFAVYGRPTGTVTCFLNYSNEYSNFLENHQYPDRPDRLLYYHIYILTVNLTGNSTVPTVNLPTLLIRGFFCTPCGTVRLFFPG